MSYPLSRSIRLSGSTVTYPLTLASVHITHGSRLRPTEIYPRDLEHFRHTPRDIRQ